MDLGEAPDEDMADIPDSPELGLNYGQRDAVDLGLGDGEIESNADDVGETTIAYRFSNTGDSIPCTVGGFYNDPEGQLILMSV